MALKIAWHLIGNSSCASWDQAVLGIAEPDHESLRFASCGTGSATSLVASSTRWPLAEHLGNCKR
ncbi:MAG: hypothetical protein ABI639_17155 [Thermoanaerobaculia bacterium]